MSVASASPLVLALGPDVFAAENRPPSPEGTHNTAAKTGEPAEGSARAEPPQVASRSNAATASTAATKPIALPTVSASASESVPADPVEAAKRAIAEAKKRFVAVRDYTCLFVKRERIDGRLTSQHVMLMKARTKPTSIYFKFQRPNKGREAIYVAGRNGGRVLAHDVGIGKFLAGTMNLDPRGSMAMEDSRHPITEAGIGALIDTVARHWTAELTPEESRVVFNTNMRLGDRACTMIESVHPLRQPNFLFHKVRLFIDQEHGLPIRFEAYDWPKKPGSAPEMVEEYTYLDLKLNVGLTELDFDPSNRSYSFGRF